MAHQGGRPGRFSRRTLLSAAAAALVSADLAATARGGVLVDSDSSLRASRPILRHPHEEPPMLTMTPRSTDNHLALAERVRDYIDRHVDEPLPLVRLAARRA